MWRVLFGTRMMMLTTVVMSEAGRGLRERSIFVVWVAPGLGEQAVFRSSSVG